jgi:hypothetical protein
LDYVYVRYLAVHAVWVVPAESPIIDRCSPSFPLETSVLSFELNLLQLRGYNPSIELVVSYGPLCETGVDPPLPHATPVCDGVRRVDSHALHPGGGPPH